MDSTRQTKVTISKSFWSRNKYLTFLEQILTGDEKGVLYVNLKCRLQCLDKDEILQLSLKADLQPKK